jgi:tetratricopeptide (TPR) repeat protein
MRLSLLATAVAVLAGCATPPPPAPAPSTAPTDTTSPSGTPEPAPGPAVEPPPPPPPPPSGPVSAAAQQQAQTLAKAAVELLERGKEDEAKAELQTALNTDPNNKLAQNLMRQITVDPVATLGKDSFAYTVRSTDTLSLIAGRFLNDIFSFYILARYNDIKVPRQVSAGQVLRIPGRPPAGGTEPPAPRPSPPPPPPAPNPPPPPPPPVSPPPPPAAPVAAEPTPGVKAMRSAEAAERAGDLDRALAEYNRAAGLDQAGAAGKATEVRRKLTQRHTQNARAAMAKQDLDGSIRSWDRVLELDPANDTAKLERQRAVALKEKLKGLGK